MIKMSKFYSFILKLLCIIGFTIGVAACSSTPSNDAVGVNNPSNPTSRRVPERLIYRVSLERSGVITGIGNLAQRFVQEFTYETRAAGTGIIIETINSLAAENQPYIVVVVNSPEDGLRGVGIVIRTSDLYVQGYIQNVNSDLINPDLGVVGTPRYYYYNDASIRSIEGIGDDNTQRLRIGSAYVDDPATTLSRDDIIASLREVDGGRITNNTTRLIVTLIAESIRFVDVRRRINIIMTSTAEENFSNLRSNLLKNWAGFGREFRRLLALPLNFLTDTEQTRLYYLQSILTIVYIKQNRS
jgi:hypothetical protein